MSAPSYRLTPTARQHLREAKAWSRARWGRELTEQYFHEVEKAAQQIAENHRQSAKRPELTGESSLGIHPVREHYLIYEPIDRQTIAIVAFLRQGRDVPAILSKYGSLLRRELAEIRKKT